MTEQSYSVLPGDTPETFPNVDVVIAIRHLHYFDLGARELDLLDRQNAMDFGGSDALPNVFFQAHGGRRLPNELADRLRAIPYDDRYLRMFAKYNPQDFVMWLNY